MVIYLFTNHRSLSVYFEDRRDAEKALSNTTVSMGFDIIEIDVIPPSN